jgi:hypothetical protein
MNTLLATLALSVAFTSKPAATHLIELFSSEGCSSCPPAEAWLGKLRGDKGLWTDFVPIAWHVDYWNYLGWKDRFSSAANSAREDAYGLRYTPAFTVDGAEWRRGKLPAAAGDAGILAVTGADGKYKIVYKPHRKGRKWTAHIALLGDGISTKVLRGENAGETLRHEFVALASEDAALTASGDTFTATITLASPAAPKLSLAAWVTEKDDLTPVQAVGGDL